MREGGQMVREQMKEMGEDVKRASSCRVGLVKSTHKEMSSNTLKAGQVRSPPPPPSLVPLSRTTSGEVGSAGRGV